MHIRNIEKKAQLIEMWRKKLPHFMELAENWIYIRVRSSDYLPISIHPDNPCGHLKQKDEKIKETSDLENAIRIAKDAEKPESPYFYRPRSDQKEKRMQAALIRHALMNNLSLHELCDGFTDVFDELIFVTDEFSAGNIRADIIALGGMKGRYFPVFIELKATRTLKRIIEQLTNIEEAMKNDARDSFLNLLANATGKPKSDIVFDEAIPLIIWTGLDRGKERDVVAKARENGFIVAEYDKSKQKPIIRTT